MYEETQAALSGKLSKSTAFKKYVHCLFAIEALRHANIANADLQLAWQYGKETGAPWAENIHMVKEFFHKNRPLLRKFVEKRLHALCKKLCDYLPILRDETLFLKTPLEPQVRTSIIRCLEEIDKDQILDRLKDERKISWAPYSEEALVRHIHSTLMPFEICDRLLCGVFDNYHNGDPYYESRHADWEYNCNDTQQIDDNKVYACQCLVKKFIDKFNFHDEDSLLIGHFSALASIFSILYRLSYPIIETPMRMDKFYDLLLKWNGAMHYIQKARRYSDLYLEAVVGDKIPEFNHDPEYNTSTLGQGYSVTTIYPNSLVEKYLVSGMFFECPDPPRADW